MPPQWHPEAPNVVPPVTLPQEERFVPSGTTPAGSSHQSENSESSKRSSEEWIASLRKNFLKRLKEQRSVQVMSDADDEEVGINNVEREELAEAMEIIKAFGRFLSESQPIISDAQLLPYPKSKIAQSHLLYERYLCDVANEYVASQDVERLKEIDQTLGPLRSCRGLVASYSIIEPGDMKDVSYFNSFKSIKDVPKAESEQCFDLKMKYASKGMKEKLDDES